MGRWNITDEGFVESRGHRLRYRVIGNPGAEPGRIPLLLLHGGPGVPWPRDPYPAFEIVAGAGRPLVLYDQLGCGGSDRPRDRSLWTVGGFVEEVGDVRRALGLERIHLYGLSWGGMLALEYLLTQPSGVASATLSSAMHSVARYEEEIQGLLDTLPTRVRTTLRRPPPHGGWNPPAVLSRSRSGPSPRRITLEARTARRLLPVVDNGLAVRFAELASRVPQLRGPAYDVALIEFSRRFTCRVDPLPLSVFEALIATNRKVYSAMWGPDEAHATGVLAGWSVTDRLGEIEVPVLVASGRHDDVTPAQTEELARALPDARLHVFEESSHMPVVEEPGEYAHVLLEFLASVEQGEHVTDSLTR
ncbi:MAG: alpha/beta fold hydrolase [Acidimicrobiia bacterium]